MSGAAKGLDTSGHTHVVCFVSPASGTTGMIDGCAAMLTLYARTDKLNPTNAAPPMPEAGVQDAVEFHGEFISAKFIPEAARGGGLCLDSPFLAPVSLTFCVHHRPVYTAAHTTTSEHIPHQPAPLPPNTLHTHR